MNKHTPGPWELEAGRTLRTRSGTFYLTYGTEPKTGKWSFDSPTELDANARLIAAAPDMLEALEDVLLMLQDMPTERYATGADKPMRERVHAIIRKARGE
jgi:hypothetical protein